MTIQELKQTIADEVAAIDEDGNFRHACNNALM
jgi:hypothetical protein